MRRSLMPSSFVIFVAVGALLAEEPLLENRPTEEFVIKINKAPLNPYAQRKLGSKVRCYSEPRFITQIAEDDLDYLRRESCRALSPLVADQDHIKPSMIGRLAEAVKGHKEDIGNEIKVLVTTIRREYQSVHPERVVDPGVILFAMVVSFGGPCITKSELIKGRKKDDWEELSDHSLLLVDREAGILEGHSLESLEQALARIQAASESEDLNDRVRALEAVWGHEATMEFLETRPRKPDSDKFPTGVDLSIP